MKKMLIIMLLASGAFTAISCGKKAESAQNKSNEVVLVKTVPVKKEAYTAPIIVTGMITSDKEARLSFKIGGLINQLLVNEGDMVSKGQLLATLNQTEINAQVVQAQQGFEKARRDAERVTALFKDSAATLEQYQNVQTAFEVARQSLSVAKFNQQYASIYATQSGRVIKKLQNEGEVVAPGSPIYIINSTAENDWVIRLGVSDKDWARMSMSDAAEVTIDAYPGKTFKAKVAEIAEAADPYTGTFQVKLQVMPGSIRFANGLIAKVNITPAQKDEVYLVPVEAILDANEQDARVYSIAADGKTPVSHQVKIAYLLEKQVAVYGGLDGVERVVTDGAAYITKDAQVKLAQ